MSSKYVGESIYNINPESNGGETVIVVTKVFDDGDGPYYNTEITLNSYGNSVTVYFCNAALSPRILRDIADKIEEVS